MKEIREYILESYVVKKVSNFLSMLFTGITLGASIHLIKAGIRGTTSYGLPIALASAPFIVGLTLLSRHIDKSSMKAIQKTSEGKKLLAQYKSDIEKFNIISKKKKLSSEDKTKLKELKKRFKVYPDRIVRLKDELKDQGRL